MAKDKKKDKREKFPAVEKFTAGDENPNGKKPPHDIGWAVKQMYNGSKVRRSGWNGKDMFLFLVPESTFEVNRAPLLGIYPEGTKIDYHSHVDMKTAQGYVVPWLCSQADLLAIDWEVVE